ncbi:MAG: phosphate ABC transporter ATP-binding protein [Candidatus Entotheonellia bacterium]
MRGSLVCSSAHTGVDQVRPTIFPLRLHEVCFAAGGQPLIDHISCALEAQPSTMVLGPNGAGKSLLLRLCHGLIQASSGSIRWNGMDARAARRHQAMVFQRPVLLRRTVAANISYALSVHGVPRRQRQTLVSAALEQAGLLELAARPARVLSGGEQQRLALARAWALKPQVLLLDEPTANLDPAATHTVEILLEQIYETGTKIIMTTHDLGQARRLADEVLFLHRGRLLEHGPAAAFFSKPQSKEAAAFLEGRLLW